MRILVTGAHGRVGAEVSAYLPRHEVVALGREALDIADRDQVEQVMGSVLPQVIVNCAAYTDVDGCELHPDMALAANALGPRHLAVAGERIGAHLLHLSTDFVFPGDSPRSYDEWDDPGPRSAYGRSKLGGELEVARHAGSWAIVRTAWVFGRRGHGFVEAVLSRARRGDPLRVVVDQVGSPTYARDLAAMLARLCVELRQGVFHVTNAGACSRYELAREVLALGGFDPSLAEPIHTRDLVASANSPVAPRPANSTLDNAALRLAGIPRLRPYPEALAERLAEGL